LPLDLGWNLLSTRPLVGHTHLPLNACPTVACGTDFGAGLLAGLATGFGAGFATGAVTGLADTTGLLCFNGTAVAPPEPAAFLTRNRWPL
jgi:hypothetical protein